MNITIRRLLEYISTHQVELDDEIHIHAVSDANVPATMIGRIPGYGIVLGNVGEAIPQ